MRDINDLSNQIREKLARLGALSESPWRQDHWPEASQALSGLIDVERLLEKLHAHAYVPPPTPVDGAA
jgi:hypothetical protein